jgi:hypothetical protein
MSAYAGRCVNRLTRCVVLCVALPLAACSDMSDSTYTLYRNSDMDANIRIHVASFDSDDGDEYNQKNCRLAAELFAQQPGVKTRFWCEQGAYRR